MDITVTISQSPASLSFEVGSFEEVVGTLQDNKKLFQEFCSVAAELGQEEGATTVGTTTAAGTASSDAAPASGRGRRKKNQPDPATAAAPAPIAPPVQSATPPAPPAAPALQAQVETAAAAGTIPPFLDRSANAAPPAPPASAAVAPPPVVPSAPPIVPTPPVSALAPKIIAEVERRAAGAPDAGKGIQDWVVQSAVAYGFVSRPAPDQWPTFAETVAVLPFQTDDKLAPIATALAVT